MSNHCPDSTRRTSKSMSCLPFRRFGLLFAALLAVASYPALLVYFHNIREAVFAQVFPPTLFFAAIGLAAWVLFGLLSGSAAKGAFVTLLFLPVFMYYSLIDDGIRSLVSDWRWWRTTPVFLCLFINLAILLRIGIKWPGANAAVGKITVVMGAVVLGLTLFNAAGGLYALASMPRAESRPAAVSDQLSENSAAVSFDGRRPNFYFFIFDEYARQDMLKKYTGYDNTPFLHELEHKKLNVSYSSYSCAPCTHVSVGNSLHYSWQYTDCDYPTAAKQSPPLYALFKRAGYKIYSLTPIFQIKKALVDVKVKSALVLTKCSVKKTVMKASFFHFFYHGDEKARAIRLGLLQQATNIIKEKTKKPKFLFFHFVVPHLPIVFDKNGGPVAYENIYNTKDPKYYVGQLRFVSKKIHGLIDTIIAEDPQAVVLLQSDHGARFFSGMQAHERLAILNCLYLSGQPKDIEGLSSLNTLRLAMNYALGLKLKPLKDAP